MLARITEPETPAHVESERGNLRLACMLQFLALALLLVALILVFAQAVQGMLESPRSPAGDEASLVKVARAFVWGTLLLGHVLFSLMAAGMWALAPVRNGCRGLGIALLVVTTLMLMSSANLASFLTRTGSLFQRERDERFPRDWREREEPSVNFESSLLAGPSTLYEWLRQVLLGWLLFAVSTTLPRRGSLKAMTMLLAVVGTLLPGILLLFVLGIAALEFETTTRGVVLFGGCALLLTAFLLSQTILSILLYDRLGRASKRSQARK